ncbi:urease subunit alpha domain protein [Pseudomonas aeruginosa]|nr:urease subunit alpha domain protein [Pseudomonas aeruginosa]
MTRRRHILGDGRVEMVADHQHVQVLVVVLRVNGRVGLVELGSTLAKPQP